MRRDAGALDAPRAQLHHYEDIIRHEPRPCGDFRGEAVGGSESLPIRLEKLYPVHTHLPALWWRRRTLRTVTASIGCPGFIMGTMAAARNSTSDGHCRSPPHAATPGPRDSCVQCFGAPPLPLFQSLLLQSSTNHRTKELCRRMNWATRRAGAVQPCCMAAVYALWTAAWGGTLPRGRDRLPSSPPPRGLYCRCG